MYRVYYFAFYTKRSLGAIYRECRLVNLKYELLACPKKPYKSRANRGRGRGLGKTAPPFASSKIGGKKGKRGRRGSSSSSAKSTRLVST